MEKFVNTKEKLFNRRSLASQHRLEFRGNWEGVKIHAHGLARRGELNFC